jgi:hypothetical protein
MADTTKKAAESIDFAELTEGGTSKIQELTSQMRQATMAAKEKANREYKFPSTYNANMGLKQGRVTELRLFFNVIPGHAEELKKELLKMVESEQRNSKAAHLMTGIQCMTCTLFDNDTRYLHCTEFDTDWDPYIDDTLPSDAQKLIYANWFQHLEETKQFGPNNLPSANDVKVAFNKARVTATVYIRTFGETCLEEYRMRDLKKAFDQMLEHPDAAKLLEHPAMKPLLEFAAT